MKQWKNLSDNINNDIEEERKRQKTKKKRIWMNEGQWRNKVAWELDKRSHRGLQRHTMAKM